MQSRLKIIDIGHSGYSLNKAISELEYNVNLCLENGNFRAIKVIHGHGTGALKKEVREWCNYCLLYTSPSPRDLDLSRMPSSA